jgi:hypothetical protein
VWGNNGIIESETNEPEPTDDNDSQHYLSQYDYDYSVESIIDDMNSYCSYQQCLIDYLGTMIGSKRCCLLCCRNDS